MLILLPEKSQTLIELQERALDFAKRAIYKGPYAKLTQARKDRLWEDAKWFLEDCFEAGNNDWDQTKGPGSGMYACDWFAERFEVKYLPGTNKWNYKYCDLGIEPKYLNALNFVVRSAIDMVDNWAGMCWGWTLGSIKAMYDGELPEWFPMDGWVYFADGPAPPVSEWKDNASICI